jgi:hypothetical protein
MWSYTVAEIFVTERDAMGDDEYHPISRTGSNLTKAGGIGYTVIDSIDTMLLMGLRDEHARAREWVADNMSLDRDDNFNTFEVTLFLCDHNLLMIQTMVSL